MFNEEDYYSDDEDIVIAGYRNTNHGRVLLPASESGSNLQVKEQSLIKVMQERGLQLRGNEINKVDARLKSKENQFTVSKTKSDFFDGGSSAPLEELVRALKKSTDESDPAQANCILNYILQKPSLSGQERMNFGIIKCKILFGLGAYSECVQRGMQMIGNGLKELEAVVILNNVARSQAQLGNVLQGYFDLLRARAILAKEMINENTQQQVEIDDFADSQVDTLTRELDHTELQFNIKMSGYKNNTNLINPYFVQFRHRKVLEVACGDYHSLFLIGAAIGRQETGKFSREVFAVGENVMGQVTGRAIQKTFKQPFLVCDLSGKGIAGVCAAKQSSLAYDGNGNIYEWGLKEIRDNEVTLAYQIGEQISKLEKGHQHYAILTKSNKFYIWGSIKSKGQLIFQKNQPQFHSSSDIIDFSCGSSCVIVLDSHGDVFGMGSNEFGQLSLDQTHASTLKKLNCFGQIRKIKCLNDSSFFVTRDEELYFIGRISYSKQCIKKPRQGQFAGEIGSIISVEGTLGNYYVTNVLGECYRWEVDASGKFKLDRQYDKVSQRYLKGFRGSMFRIKSLIKPELAKLIRLTQDCRSFEKILFQLSLRDQFGPYGNQLIVPLRCQIMIRPSALKEQDILQQNKLFLQNNQIQNLENLVHIKEIGECRLVSVQLKRRIEQPWICDLSIISQESGKFYLYFLTEDKLISQVFLDIRPSEKQRQFCQKSRLEKAIRQEEKRRKIEMEKQRILQQKLKRGDQEKLKLKETQKRAEQVMKKQLREQSQQKANIQEERKQKRQFKASGGFDLSKLRKSQLSRTELKQKSNELSKTNESFLPDINTRNSSKHKINFSSKNNRILDPAKLQKSKIIEEMSTGPGMAGLGLTKTDSIKERERQKLVSPAISSQFTKSTLSVHSSLVGPVAQPKTAILKRGLSRGIKM